MEFLKDLLIGKEKIESDVSKINKRFEDSTSGRLALYGGALLGGAAGYLYAKYGLQWGAFGQFAAAIGGCFGGSYVSCAIHAITCGIRGTS